MAYQQHSSYDTSFPQHYDHRTPSYNVPPLQGPGQRDSDLSERRFDHTRGYRYENGDQGTREHGEYSNRLQGYPSANSPRRLGLGQPTNYRPPQGEAQILYERRQRGLEQPYSSNAEAWGRGRGRGRGEGARPWPDIRPVKSQENETARRIPVQAKPRMSV